MARAAAACVAICVAAGLTSSISVHAATVPAGFEEALVATVPAPTALAFTPDGRLLIASQPGALYVYEHGVLVDTPALDLSSRICTELERGLLGVAVDPGFAANGFIYVFYTFDKFGGCAQSTVSSPVNRVSRFTLSIDNRVDVSSELILIDNIPSPDGGHNAGDVQIGRDGLLYVSVGDGRCDYRGDSGCAGQNDASRDQHVLLGKILRITRSGGIPAGNPFQGSDSVRCSATGRANPGQKCQETFAWGLRNPFRIAFDPNASATRFFINDVGQSTWEEIDEGIAGADYGWNVREGYCARSSTANCGAPPPGMTNPIYAYDHSGACTAISGGAFVPDSAWPAEYRGSYLFGDYVCERMFRLTQNADGTYSRTSFASGLGDGGPVTMIFGPFGGTQALYYTSYAGGGQVRRIAAATGNRAPSAVAAATPRSGPVPLAVRLDASGSSDPDGDPLTFTWTFGDGSPAAAGSVVTHTYPVPGRFTATLTARDTHGATHTASVTIDAGNTPPLPSITSPSAGARFAVGQSITLRGAATDAEEGTLADVRLSWTVILHHDEHTHPFLGPLAGNGAVFQAPAPEDLAATDTSYLEIRLTATDSQGASATVVRNFLPRLVDVTFNASPAGLTLTVNGAAVATPQTFTSWEGYQLRTHAPTQKDAAGQAWLFSSWSDGGAAASHTFVTPASAAAYAAEFVPAVATAPAADAYVRNGDHAALNFGASPELVVKHASNPDNQRQSFLRFEIASGGIGRAVLRLHGGLSSAGAVPVAAYGVTDTSWLEAALTWTTRPPRGSTELASAVAASTSRSWHEWDVTDYVKAERAAGRTALGFALITSVATQPYASFSSRSASSNRPELLIAEETGVPSPLPAGWLSRDIGAVGVPGSAAGAADSMTVSGAGGDVWGTSDAFHYAWMPLAGDGTVTARVSSVAGAHAWTKVGVMIRASTAPDSAHAFMLVSAGRGLAFQRRRSGGGASEHTSGGSGTAPRWVRLERRANVVTASVSTTGASWTVVGSDTIDLPSTALAGLAVTSHDATRPATGVFDHVRVEASGWQSADIGAVGLEGSASGSADAMTVTGAGADVWGTADAFHYAWMPVTGDATVTARVSSIAGAHAWTKAGVMIRAERAAGSAHAFMLVSSSRGLAFQRRPSVGAASVHTSGGSGTAPCWLRLVRRGNIVTAYVSATGESWTEVGSDTIDLPPTALLGLAVTSHDAGRLATGAFDNVRVHAGPP